MENKKKQINISKSPKKGTFEKRSIGTGRVNREKENPGAPKKNNEEVK